VARAESALGLALSTRLLVVPLAVAGGRRTLRAGAGPLARRQALGGGGGGGGRHAAVAAAAAAAARRGRRRLLLRHHCQQLLLRALMLHLRRLLRL